jgi:hypothetical protein
MLETRTSLTSFNLKEKAKIIASRITLKRRFSWALKDSAKFKLLIAELQKHNDALHLLGPEWAFELLQINLALEYLPRQSASELSQLQQSLSSSSSSKAKPVAHNVGAGAGNEDEPDMGEVFPAVSPSEQGLELLYDLASIKAEASLSAREEKLSLEEEKRLLCFDEDAFTFQQDMVMAVLWTCNQTVFVERHSYRTPKQDRKLSQRIRTNILKLARLLQLPVCTKHLHTLELLGLVEFHAAQEIGFVYRLPDSLGHHKKGYPIEDANIRKPREALVNLEGEPSPPLGWRFDLARKLVQSVSFLHASGWLHKNIRTSELYLFPKSNRDEISRTREGMDYGHPFVLGYRFSRPDDVQDRPLSQQQIQEKDGDISPLRESIVQRATQSEPVRHPQSTQPVVVGGYSESDSRVSSTLSQPISDHTKRPATPDVDQKHSDTDDESKESMDFSYRVKAHTRERHRVTLDRRHHPSKLAYPDRRYCHAFDVYSLGIALVEIGLWCKIETLTRRINEYGHDPFQSRRVMIHTLEDELRFGCGEVYTKVALACLTVDPEHSEIGLAEQRELCARIAADLAQCRA